MKNICRVCGHVLGAKALLSFNNMPKSAQNFPDADSLSQDKGENLDIFGCPGCGLAQLTVLPVPYYREVIRAAAFSEEMRTFRHKQFGHFVKKYRLKGRKVLELGCGRGEYLSIMKRQGVKASGLEYSKSAVDCCKSMGLNVERGYLSTGSKPLKSGPFDAFYIMNFLEHFPDPKSSLEAMGDNLRSGGIGLVEVPNFDMIIRKHLFSEFIKDHLLYFTKDTLETALKLSGFEVLESKVVWHDYIISSVVKKRELPVLESFYDSLQKIKKELTAFLGKHRKGRVAVWGASHQALAVMALAELAGKISYVVDSAPFKQGKFTTATHIPIVSPELLDLQPVSAIIIMAASYSDEVARIIKKKYGKKIKTAILRDYGLEIKN